MKLSKETCAATFLQEAATSQDRILEVRRFVREHDTAELTTASQVIIRCRLGGCAVTITATKTAPLVEATGCKSFHSQTEDEQLVLGRTIDVIA